MYLSFVFFRLLKGVTAAAGRENVVVVVSQQCRDGSQNTWIVVTKKNGLLFRSDHHGAKIRAGICREGAPSSTSQKPDLPHARRCASSAHAPESGRSAPAAWIWSYPCR